MDLVLRVVLVVVLGAGARISALDYSPIIPCRSNTTHISWTVPNHPVVNGTTTAFRRTTTTIVEPSFCQWQTRKEAENELYDYLRQHVMQFDLPFLETMGFHEEDVGVDDLPDGLDLGLVGETILYALQSKIEFQYADELPIQIFRQYVLNYANANEARSNWRPLFWQKLRFLVQPTDNIPSVVHTLNANMWKILSPVGQDLIYFKASSTPLVFDPMSILAFGYASCTGTAIMLVNALRTMGVPARLVGTAAWNQQRSMGNHNWVEVWYMGSWYFVEPSLSNDPFTPPELVDDLFRDPCTRWFCGRAQFTGNLSNTTLVFAATLEPSLHSISFPLAWEWSNRGVPGEDVSQFYQNACSRCQITTKDTLASHN